MATAKLPVRQSAEGHQEIVFNSPYTNTFIFMGFFNIAGSLFMNTLFVVLCVVLFVVGESTIRWGDFYLLIIPFAGTIVMPAASVAFFVSACTSRRLRFVLRSEGEGSDGVEMMREPMLARVLRCVPAYETRFIPFSDIRDIVCKEIESRGRKGRMYVVAYAGFALRDGTCLRVTPDSLPSTGQEFTSQLKELLRHKIPRMASAYDGRSGDQMPRGDFDMISAGGPPPPFYTHPPQCTHHEEPPYMERKLPHVPHQSIGESVVPYTQQYGAPS